MKLVANECVNCRRPVGYLTPEALQIPTICPLCAFDREIMKEFGHTIDKREKPVSAVLRDIRFNVDRLELKEKCRVCGGGHPPDCCAKDGHGG